MARGACAAREVDAAVRVPALAMTMLLFLPLRFPFRLEAGYPPPGGMCPKVSDSNNLSPDRQGGLSEFVKVESDVKKRAWDAYPGSCPVCSQASIGLGVEVLRRAHDAFTPELIIRAVSSFFV